MLLIGGPCIVPFYVPEKSGIMQISTMQDTVYCAILNGTIQCKWYHCETVLCKEVLYARTPILSKEISSMKKIMPQHQVPLVLKFIFLFRSWIPTLQPTIAYLLT